MRLTFLALFILVGSLLMGGQSDAQVGQGELVKEQDLEKSLGSYEQSALSQALRSRGLTLEEHPAAKILGKIHVVNIDVFGKEEGILKLLNILHVTTREYVIEREVLLRPGELWDEKVIEETNRELKDPLFTSLVVLRPVVSPVPGKVDLLVVTRDIWSLRMNSSYEFQQGKFTSFQMSVAENNILGRRKHGAFGFIMDQGKISIGPQYVDKALGGTHLQLRTRFNGIVGRASRAFEGTSSFSTLEYPVWSLRQKWGAKLRVSHFDSIVRSFRGTALEVVDNPDTDEKEEVPWEYQFKTLKVQSHVARSFGSAIKTRVTLGHNFFVGRPEVLSDFRGTAADRVALEKIVFPRSERESSVFLNYSLFTPQYKIYRNLDSFDLAEDVRLGPTMEVGLSLALKVIGSENNFYRAYVRAGWAFAWSDDGVLHLSSNASTRLQGGEAIDNKLGAAVELASPRLWNAVRVVAQSELQLRLRERGNGRYVLGGNNGLRGYIISEFSGQKRWVSNLELRSMPMRLRFARVGALLFWDMGHVADKLNEIHIKHGVGLGLRALVPQLQPVVFRLDWAFPLQGEAAGWPGRISAGVAQTF